MFRSLQAWWAKRLAIKALCLHLIECGDQWKVFMDYSRSCGYWQIFHHGTIRIKRGVRLSDGTRPDGVMYINDVAMNKWTARRINLAIKQRGNNLTIYKDIVKALQPQNISLQIEEVRSS